MLDQKSRFGFRMWLLGIEPRQSLWMPNPVFPLSRQYTTTTSVSAIRRWNKQIDHHFSSHLTYGQSSDIPVSRMTDGVHVRIQTGYKLAGTCRYHCYTGRQQHFVTEGTDECEDGVRGPCWKRNQFRFHGLTMRSGQKGLTCHEEETYRDGRFGDSNFGWGSVSSRIRTQWFDVHFLGLNDESSLVGQVDEDGWNARNAYLRSKRFLMPKHMAHDLTVVVDNHRHWNDVAECKQNGHK